MTLKLTEGFDWFETADLPNAYGAMSDVQPVGTKTETIEATGGRNGDKSYKVTPGTATNDERFNNIQGKGFATGVVDGAEVIFGFAVKFDTVASDGNCAFAGITNGGISTTSYNINLVRLSSGFIAAGHTNGTLYAGSTGSTSLNAGVWYYVECKFTPDNTTGAIEVRINGSIEFTLTSIDTQWTTDPNVSLTLGATIPATVIPVIEFDDVYICDDLGSRNNTYLGDVEVRRLAPSGNGNTSNFTGSDADSTDNYLHVDDAGVPDDDTSYVEDSTSANKDLYTYENLPISAANVKAVAVKTLGKKLNSGAPDLKAVVRSNVTETDSAVLGMGISYQAKQAVYEVDPNTATDWTTAGVDAMEAGVKVE